MKIICFIVYIFCLLCFHTPPLQSTVWPTDFLFSVNCDYADIHHKQRIKPVIAVAHDSLIVFPAYPDTLLLLRFNGIVEHKIHHAIGSYPVKIEYDNIKDVIHYLIQKPNTKHLQLFTLNNHGEIQNTYTLKSNFLKNWLKLAEGSIQNPSYIYKAVAEWCKKKKSQFSANSIGVLLLYRGLMHNDTVFVDDFHLFSYGSSFAFYVLSSKKFSDFFGARNFRKFDDLPFRMKICDSNQQNYYNMSKTRGTYSYSPLKNRNALINVYEESYGFYFFIMLDQLIYV